MREFTFLIPVLRDSDRQPHTAALLEQFEEELIEHFGGFTSLGQCTGKWRDERGEIIFDLSRRYSVAIPEQDTEFEVKFLLATFKTMFDQQCIYVAETSQNAFLL